MEETKRSNVRMYLYHILMAVLAITNTLFLIVNINNWKVEISETSILLTFIGFFFAFAGMYIYSLFNINVDIEKKAINELREKYENELIQAKKDMSSVRNLLSFYQIGQLIVNSPSISTQHLAWVEKFQVLYDEQTNYLNELSKINPPLYASYKDDFTEVCRGLEESLRFMIKRIDREKEQFFAESKLPENVLEQLLDDIKNLVLELSDGFDRMHETESSQNEISQEKHPLIQRIREALNCLKG